LLLEAANSAVDLRSLPSIPDDLAKRLGVSIAQIHTAGVDQPDMFAKHVLVVPETAAVTILDWQRAVLRRSVPWPNRIRGLAALRATAPAELIPDPTWDQLLTSYLRECVRSGYPRRDCERLRDEVAAVAGRLLRRPGIRSHRQSFGVQVRQELVRIGGETACAIPAVASGCQSESAIAGLYDPSQDGQAISLAGGRVGRLRVRRYVLPFGRWWAAVRGRSWRSPELRAARLLFNLERHGIPAPRLYAYGQTVPLVAPASSFLLYESLRANLVGPAHEAAVLELLDLLHAAGCQLSSVGVNGEPFGVVGDRVVVQEIDRVRLVKRLGPRQVQRDRARVDAYFRGQR
jgi:hypothetical protein